MKDETIKKVKEHENYTLLLDGATDESLLSKLSLIACVVESGEVHNLFLSLLELRRCDAESIVKLQNCRSYCLRENLEITNVRFSGIGWLLHNGQDLSWCSILFRAMFRTLSLHPLPQS